MSLRTFRSLDAHDRALVAIAVLVDGNEAGQYLEGQDDHAVRLRTAAAELCGLEVDVRLVFAGTALRLALAEGE